jgi:diphthamide synthase (EF-2-diphthine--ammonia ligase)
MYYEPGMTKEEGDEVEDLYALVRTAKEAFPEIQGVASGAIFSNY